MLLTFLAACSGTRKSDSSAGASRNNPQGGATPNFALPGVPLKTELLASPAKEAAQPAEKKPAEGQPAEAQPAGTAQAEAVPAAATPPETATAAVEAVEARPAEASVVTGGDLDFHLDAAKKYSAKRKYRSAAAEYEAAFGFLPAGDFRAVHVLERQGAMMLKAGNEAKAREHFLAAIKKAQELNIKGSDLSNSYLGLGYCMEKEHKAPDAISDYEKALEFAAGKTTKDRIAETLSNLKKAP